METTRRPIHVTDFVVPDAVISRSPIASVSTGTSPPGVAIDVPAQRQATSNVWVEPDDAAP